MYNDQCLYNKFLLTNLVNATYFKLLAAIDIMVLLVATKISPSEKPLVLFIRLIVLHVLCLALTVVLVFLREQIPNKENITREL